MSLHNAPCRALGGVAAPEVEAPPDLQPLCLLRGTPKEGTEHFGKTLCSIKTLWNASAMLDAHSVAK